MIFYAASPLALTNGDNELSERPCPIAQPKPAPPTIPVTEAAIRIMIDLARAAMASTLERGKAS
jgi:hypothetical protein